MLRLFLIIGASVALALSAFAQPATVDEQTAVQIEALDRLKGVDLDANAGLKAAVLRVLDKTRGTPHFVSIVRDFKLKGHSPTLLDYAFRNPDNANGIEAFGLALSETGTNSIPVLLASTNGPTLVRLMGNSRDKNFVLILKSIIQNPDYSLPNRQMAVASLARTEVGARFLLDLAKEEKLSADLKLTASSELNVAPWPEIKKAALEMLPLPQTKNAESLPPIYELAKRPGNPNRGREIFASQTAACSACHVVNGQGIDVGPQLSEIGTKLGKEALYQSILDPSSGISFGFEAWNLQLKNEDELFGLITSETADEITVKSQTGVVTKVRKSEIANRQKLATSLMPADLQLTMTTQDLVDLVEYLVSLKKAEPAK